MLWLYISSWLPWFQARWDGLIGFVCCQKDVGCAFWEMQEFSCGGLKMWGDSIVGFAEGGGVESMVSE